MRQWHEYDGPSGNIIIDGLVLDFGQQASDPG
jgi:hypothetical protein